MNNDLILTYFLKNSDKETVHFFGYLDNQNDELVCAATGQSVGSIILSLQKSYSERFASSAVMSEKEFFCKENNYLIPEEVSISEYDEKFNILPPSRMYNGYNFSMFMVTEALGGGLYSYFLVTFEPYSKNKLKAYKIVAFKNDPLHKIFESCPI